MSSSTSSSSSSSITLTPLTKADIPTAAKICGQSMSSDRHTMLKAAHPTKPYNHEQGMYGAFDYWMSQPLSDTECVKAVDSATGEILGFVCWHKCLEDQPETSAEPQESAATSAATSEATPEATPEAAPTATPEKPEVIVSPDRTLASTPPADALAELNDITSAHLAAYQRRIMPSGTKAMFIGTLAVDPSVQKRGVGSMLIRYGTDIADREGVICWVHSSDGAEGVYAKCGFEVDDVLSVELDEWARRAGIGVPSGWREWGTYRFRYMVRQPRS